MPTTTPYFSAESKACLASLLGPWAVLPEEEGFERDNRCTLAYTGTEPLRHGARLHLQADRYGHKGMLVCHGRNHYYDGTDSHYLGNFLRSDDKARLGTDINISQTKPLAQLAKDLQRRLIPAYLAGYELGMVALGVAKARHAHKLALAQQLAAVLPGGKVSGGKRLEDQVSIWTQGPTWRIAYDASLEHFSMSFAQAHLLAALLTSDAWHQAKA